MFGLFFVFEQIIMTSIYLHTVKLLKYSQKGNETFFVVVYLPFYTF